MLKEEDRSLQDQLLMEPIKLPNKWNANEVRFAFDDLICRYMTDEMKFNRDYYFINLRLIIIILINLLGSGTALYAFLTPFAKAKMIVALGAVSYLVILGLWTVYQGWIMPKYFFKGCNKGGKKHFYLTSKLELPEAAYSIQLHCNRNGIKAGKLDLLHEFAVSLGDWVDVDGYIDPISFCQSMNKEIKNFIEK